MNGSGGKKAVGVLVFGDISSSLLKEEVIGASRNRSGSSPNSLL
jgi:hypothetical protein